MSRRKGGDSVRFSWSVRPDPHEARRWQLMVAARAVAERQGADFTVEDVTREAGVAKGTFYLYFTSRDELLSAIRIRLTEDTAEMMLEAAVGPWGELWARVIAAGAARVTNQGNLGKLFKAECSTEDVEHQIMLDATRKIVQAGLDAEVFALPSCEPHEAERVLQLTVEHVSQALTNAWSMVAAGDTEAGGASTAVLNRLVARREQPGGLAWDVVES